MTEDELINAIQKALANHLAGDAAKHNDDHEFIQMLKDREKRRVERWRKFQLSFIGGVALLFLSGMVWLGSFILEHLGVHLK